MNNYLLENLEQFIQKEFISDYYRTQKGEILPEE